MIKKIQNFLLGNKPSQQNNQQSSSQNNNLRNNSQASKLNKPFKTVRNNSNNSINSNNNNNVSQHLKNKIPLVSNKDNFINPSASVKQFHIAKSNSQLNHQQKQQKIKLNSQVNLNPSKAEQEESIEKCSIKLMKKANDNQLEHAHNSETTTWQGNEETEDSKDLNTLLNYLDIINETIDEKNFETIQKEKTRIILSTVNKDGDEINKKLADKEGNDFIDGLESHLFINDDEELKEVKNKGKKVQENFTSEKNNDASKKVLTVYIYIIFLI